MKLTKTPPAPVNETKVVAWCLACTLSGKACGSFVTFSANEMINVVELIFATLHCTNN